MTDISDIIASIVDRWAGSCAREGLAADLQTLVNAEMERCAKVAEWFRGNPDAAKDVDHRATIASINTCLDSVAAKIRTGK